MSSPFSRSQRRSMLFLEICLAVALLLAGCGSPGSTQTPTQAPVPTFSLSPAPILPSPTPAEPPAFPLAGKWKGTAHNGGFIIPVTLEVASTCLVGEGCATINLSSIPCTATFTLLSEQGFLYEFRAGNFTGSCGAGQDFLELLPDGTVKYTSVGDYGETTGILTRYTPRLVIFDDDGSPDGTTALVYLLSRPDVEVRGVGISYGEAHPAAYIQHMGRMLEDFGFTGIPLGAGIDGSLSGNTGFPEWLREASARFWDWRLPYPEKTYPVEDSASMLIRLLDGSEGPIDLFFSGPVTNLERALRRAPEIRDHIGTLYMMAGAVYVPGNVHDFYPDSANIYADWNPYSDPLAYQEVFEAGIRMVLIPLDATNQVPVRRQDTQAWRAGGRMANFAADVYDWLIGGENGQSYIWDMLAAAVMTEPDLCGYQDLHLDVITEEGDHFGQLVVVASEPPNIRVCLQPDGDGIRQNLVDVFSASR